MSRRAIAVAVADRFLALVDAQGIGQWVEQVLDAEGIAGQTEVSVLVTDDALMQSLNREFRGADEPTDVLSFPLSLDTASPSESEPGFILPPDNVLRLGEIVISYPYAVRQATALAHPVDWELAHLVVHGVLHLLGYDHLEPEDEQEMHARERAILGSHD